MTLFGMRRPESLLMEYKRAESDRRVAELQSERDFWIMKYMRLEAAINHHEKTDAFKDSHDEALYKMRDKLTATHPA